MIKSEHGAVSLKGGTLDIINDFANIISGVRSTLLDAYSPEAVDKLIALCGQLSYANNEKDSSKEAEIVAEIGRILVAS